MKTKTITSILILFSASLLFAGEGTLSKITEVSDSVNLITEFSLFYEAHKNKDYDFALEHGWTVINTDPSSFLRFKPFKKMEEILWYQYENNAESEEEKDQIADTTIYLYDKAVEYKDSEAGYFLARKAFVLETWKEADSKVIVEAYEAALEADPNLDSFYKDRLGQVYARNATEENGWKMKALDLYSALTEQDPENAVWLTRIDALAENIDELIEIRKKAWALDKNNIEKAYTYAETCLRAQMYEKALEALQFLTEKSPDVINYWRKLASTYTKLDRNDEAIQAYKKLIELEPNNRDNYLNIGIIYQKLGQLSVARSYFQKAQNASEEKWDLPIYYEAQLYETAARNCGFEFMDKCVYQLAVDTYKRAAGVGGQMSGTARDRVQALANSVPQAEDYFFRKLKSGTEIKIEGDCYGWINRSITVP